MNLFRRTSLISKLDVVTYDHEPGQFYFGYWYTVSILVWAQQADASAMRRLDAMTAHLTEKHPFGRSAVAFVLPGTAPPTEKARKVFERHSSGETGLCCVGMVLEGEGFWASALRATMTNIHLSNANEVALKQADSIEEIAPWLAQVYLERTGEELPRVTLVAALQKARHELAPPLIFPDAG